MSISGKKLLKLNNMDTWSYKKPCREISAKENCWINKYCRETINEDKLYRPIKWPDCINGCFYSNHKCNCTKEMIENHNNELLYQYEMITKQSLTFMKKLDFDKSIKNITKKIGEFFLPYAWITISPRKYEKRNENLRIAILLDKILRMYFYGCFQKTDSVHWCIEFGSEGKHAHTHILCRPIEQQQKSFIKNFSRDFTTLWKKNVESKYIGILDLKKIAFKLNTLRRPEFIDDKLKYLRNETKDAIHENPYDEEMFNALKIKKYENC